MGITIDMTNKPPSEKMGYGDKFMVWYILAQLVGLVCVIMMAIWVTHYEGGLAWRWSPLQFNWHPFLMTIGFIYLFANSIMIYRGLRDLPKLTLKRLHAAIHVGAIVCVTVALVAVFDYKNNLHYPNLTSLHSWIGLLTIIMFVTQWVISFLLYLHPGGPMFLRAKALPIHTFMGISIFGMATIAAVTGIFQSLSWIPFHHSMSSKAIFGNIMGLLFCLFAGLVIHVVSRVGFKRLDYHVYNP